jgi:preprotein translocase subunit YajC
VQGRRLAGFSQGECWGRRLDSAPHRRNYNAAPADRRAVTEEGFPVFISNAYAQSTAAAPTGAAGMMQFLPLVLMFVVLYFIMIRPQMKRQKELRAMIEALAKGDEVVLGGGIIGKVAKLGDSVLHIEVAKDVEIQVQRTSVVQVLPKGTYK